MHVQLVFLPLVSLQLASVLSALRKTRNSEIQLVWLKDAASFSFLVKLDQAFAHPMAGDLGRDDGGSVVAIVVK